MSNRRTRFPTAAVTLALVLVAAPAASAASLDLYGAHWVTDEADTAFGGGLTLSFANHTPVGLELRGAYYEPLTNEPIENLFEGNAVVEEGLEVLPLEAGVRFNLTDNQSFRPYLAGGGGYYMLDSDFGDVDDEFGWYAALGSTFGDSQGPQFFLEANYRNVEGSVVEDPAQFDDIDDLDFDGSVPIDLSGIGVNAGVSWRW